MPLCQSSIRGDWRKVVVLFFMQSLKMMKTHPGVLGLLDLQNSLVPGEVIHLLEGLYFAPERPLGGIVGTVPQGFIVPYRGAVYEASGAAGREGRFECWWRRKGLVFCRRVLAARVLAACGTAWTRVVVSRGVELPPRHLHLWQHFYLKDIWICVLEKKKSWTFIKSFSKQKRILCNWPLKANSHRTDKTASDTSSGSVGSLLASARACFRAVIWWRCSMNWP